jgi:class III poly(R)-hydroxyalkanoic acid synthase PhaE subunit
MSEKKSPQEWMQDWQALQKQYWSAWSDATRQVTGQAPVPTTPWHEGLEQWSRMFTDAGKQTETAERVLGSAKGYVALMQSMLAAAAGRSDVSGAMQGGPMQAGPMQAWSDALRTGFNMPGIDPALLNNPMAAMLQGIRGDGVQGFDKLAQSFAPFLAQAKQEGMSWLQAPAFGFAREHQEHYQKMFAAFVEYQDALKRYNELMLRSSQRSFEIFESKLGERAEPGRQIESLRGLYDLWVDAAEEAYAQIALSEEFRKVYGDVVNSQMRVRAQVQAEIERVGTDLGMPTRTELNSVHKRLHELRREFRNANGADAAEQIGQLREEVRRLRAQLDARASDTAPKATVAKTAAAKAEPARAARKKHHPHRYQPESDGTQQAKPDKKPGKRAAAVARPRSASKHAASSFGEAISTMRANVATTASSGKRTRSRSKS